MRVDKIQDFGQILEQLGVTWSPQSPIVEENVIYTGSGIQLYIYGGSSIELKWLQGGQSGTLNFFNRSDTYQVIPDQNVTNPYNVLVCYKITTDQIIVRYSDPAAVPDTLSLYNDEVLISEFQIPATGSPIVIPPPVTTLDAENIVLDTTNFDNNLSSTDTDVQTAMETLDEITEGLWEDSGTVLSPITNRGITVQGSGSLDVAILKSTAGTMLLRVNNSGFLYLPNTPSVTVPELTDENIYINASGYLVKSTDNQWKQIIYTSRTDNNTFVSNAIDYSNYIGWGCKVTDGSSNDSYHIIDNVTFATNSTIDVVGEPLPATITSIEICNPSFIEKIDAAYSGVDVENTSNDIFDNVIEVTNPASINIRLVVHENCKFIYALFETQGAATTTDYIMNIRLNSDANDLLTSNLTVNANKVNSGVLTDGTYNSLTRNDIIRTRITTAGDGTTDGLITYFLIRE